MARLQSGTWAPNSPEPDGSILSCRYIDGHGQCPRCGAGVGINFSLNLTDGDAVWLPERDACPRCSLGYSWEDERSRAEDYGGVVWESFVPYPGDTRRVLKELQQEE